MHFPNQVKDLGRDFAGVAVGVAAVTLAVLAVVVVGVLDSSRVAAEVPMLFLVIPKTKRSTHSRRKLRSWVTHSRKFKRGSQR
jgi:hypothetical protein